MKPLHVTALVLAVIGAINWGLVGLFQLDLVAALFGGQGAPLARLVYALVGIAGLILAVTATQYIRADTLAHRGGREHYVAP